MRKLVLSVTARDCEWTYFRGSGAGGQKRNKTSNCARCAHAPSGAVGIGQDGRSQTHNRRTAFKQMAESEKFRAWVRLECARWAGHTGEAERYAEREIRSSRVRVEVQQDGRWVAECATL